MSEENKIDIIDFICWDVKFALEQLNQQIKNKQYKFLYIESSRKLFDIPALRYYFEATEIKNTMRINDIYDNCLKVVDLHNIEIPQLETYKSDRKFSTDFEIEGGGYIKIAVDYDCLRIDGKEVFFVTPIGQKDFFYRNKFEQYESATFAKKCAQIFNDITVFIPDFFKKSFYIDLVAKLYNKLNQTSPSEFDPYNFIEERHREAEVKGKDFYQNVLKEFNKYKEAKTSIKTGRFLYDDCIEYVNYCNDKIDFCNNEINCLVDEKRYKFSGDYKGNSFLNSLYESVRRRISEDGFYEIVEGENSFKVYEPYLATILSTLELPVNNSKNEIEIINGYKFLDDYIKGYERGEGYFDKDFALSPDVLYSNNAEHYVKNIQHNYFYSDCYGMKQGWNFVRTHHPNFLTSANIEKYGYYSGIINRVDQLVKQHPSLFITFEMDEDKSKNDKDGRNEKAVLTITSDNTRASTLFKELSELNFFALPKTEKLSIETQNKLIELLNKNPIPYQVAMLEHLGFITHLKSKHVNSNKALYKSLAKILKSNERTIKGNLNVLNEVSREDKKRYTAFLHKTKVTLDFSSLK